MLVTGPLYVGFSGPAGSGKTSTANLIAPGGPRLGGYQPVVFDHYYLARPIYDIVGIKRQTLGDDRDSRILYGLHDVVSELLGRRPDFEDLIELVYDLHAMDAGNEGDPKPRTFMQTVGDMCRSHYVDCFVDAVLRRAEAEYKDLDATYEAAELDAPINFVLISDTRRLNEFDKLAEQGNAIFIRLEASREVLEERLLERDGTVMTPEQWDHATEREANEIPKDRFDLVLNTDYLSLEGQATAVRNFLLEQVGFEIQNKQYVKIPLRVGV